MIRLDGTVAEGDLAEMSPEVVALHTGVYRARPQAGAVIHTHSPHLLAFALARRPLPARYEPWPGTPAVLLGDRGVLAVGPDTQTTVSPEEAAGAGLRAAALG